MPLQTFEDAFNTLQPGDIPSILLANGFSQAWDHNIFNYQNLLQQANFGSRDALIREIFINFDTYDFEKIMRALEAAESVCESYGFDQVKINEIKSDQQVLKDSLIKAIAKTHPLTSGEVTTQQYEYARDFIVKFQKIFTLNYDLLLYWITNKNEIKPKGYFTNDGFRKQNWENRPEQNVYFLHGGLHLYDDGHSICKHKFKEGSADKNGFVENITIVDQVQDNLDKGRFPLFVSEPTHEKKLARIKHNPYLNYCFNVLKTLNNPLFIHGHSMSGNDEHIFYQIRNSKIDRVFVSIFGDEYSQDNKATMANAVRFIKTERVSVEFYDASSAPIWP